MRARSRKLFISVSQIFIFVFLVVIHIVLVGVDALDSAVQGERRGHRASYDCPQCISKEEQGHIKLSAAISNHPSERDIDIIVTYSDLSGAVQIRNVKSRDLSASWVWKHPTDDKRFQANSFPVPFEPEFQFKDSDEHSTGDHQSVGEMLHLNASAIHPVKLKRRNSSGAFHWNGDEEFERLEGDFGDGYEFQVYSVHAMLAGEHGEILRKQRRDLRTAELIRRDREIDNQMQAAAIKRAKELDTTVKGKYSIWRKEYESPNSDSTLKLMRDQIIMAKAYASVAKAKHESHLYDSLVRHSRESQHAIGEATSDAELPPRALDHAKNMGHMLSMAKDRLYDCITIARKLRAMLQLVEMNLNAVKKKSAFLIQLAAKTVPRTLHCLPLLLTTDYYAWGYNRKEFPNKEKLEDPSLYHYAIFSDNVLATSVVVNSTVLHAKEPEKHVFHIVTDKLNFAAMKMWFLVHPPASATIEVQNVDDFSWLNSSYCPVLRQLESAQMKEYYFKANQASSLTAGSDNLKYRNPKYLSMLNHLRFYLPQVYPKLDKILFLDDDIVVQKDLTPLWSVDLKGMVNGAVETCKESFHRFDKYLNFSNPKISENFDSNACGWAFGMNVFDLKEWTKRDITGIYHHWQDLNEDRTLWKLGTLPPGLITFYNLTHPLDRSWHVLGLGYDPALNQTEIQNAAVVHYNGNYKPWLDLAIAKYRSYWSRYVLYDNVYLQLCNINE